MVDENSLMASEKEVSKKDTDKFFSELVNKSPLFELGFSEDRLFYDESPTRLNVLGTYFPQNRNLESIKSSQSAYEPSSAGADYYSRIAKRMESGEIPQGDFVYMGGIMKPEDRVRTAFTKDEVAKMGTLSGAVSVRDLLDRTDELGTHVEEFVHRALRVVPELDEWRKNNITRSKDEEALMGYIVSKYFPDLADRESKRILNVYNVDINEQMNVDILDNWSKQIETIASNVLKNKKIKPKLKLKPDSIMYNPNTESKKEKTFMEIIKSLFK